MKRFMFLSIGVLCLMLAVAVGYHLGSMTAQANEAALYGIAYFEDGMILDVNGKVWTHDWLRHPSYDLPTSVSTGEIAMWSHASFVTYGGDVWKRDSPNVWVNMGKWPDGQPVPASNESWGSIKQKLDKGDN